jgi:hypothetical protein
MWHNLNYNNQKMIQAYFHQMNAVYPEGRGKNQKSIPRAVLNFIDADVFETLLKCIVTDFNNQKFDTVYLTKIANLAISNNFREHGAFVRIWEKLNLDAQNYLIGYFATDRNFNKQSEVCEKLKSEDARRRERQDAISRMSESGEWSFQNLQNNEGWERL